MDALNLSQTRGKVFKPYSDKSSKKKTKTGKKNINRKKKTSN